MSSGETSKPGTGGPAGGANLDKDVEMAVNAISAKVDDVRGSLSSFVGKMEHEALTWPSTLNSFAAISGQFSTLIKQLGNDKVPPLYRQVLLPHQVSSERDAELEKTTEGRVPVLHHEIVPDYLRTKLDLDLESRQKELYSEAGMTSPTFNLDYGEINPENESSTKKNDVRRYNQLLDSVISLVDEASEDKQRSKFDTLQPTSLEETKKLVAAYINGTGLQQMTPNRKAMLIGKTASTQQTGGHPHQQQAMQRANTLSRVAPPIRPVHPSQSQVVQPGNFNSSPYKQK